MNNEIDNKEKIIDKIKKLLALANNNPSEAEASSAMLKAQQLMAEYNVSVDVADEATEQIEVVVCQHKWDMGFRKPLGVALANNFRCECFILAGSIAFMGHDIDVRIAKEVFEYAYNFALSAGNRQYNRAYAMGANTKGVFNSYTLGFIRGIMNSLEKQSTALAIIVPPDVKEKFEEDSKDWKSGKAFNTPDNLDPIAFRSGVTDGKSIIGNRQLEG